MEISFFSVFVNQAKLYLFDVIFFGTFKFNVLLMHSLSYCHFLSTECLFWIISSSFEDMNNFISLHFAFLNLKVSLRFGLLYCGFSSISVTTISWSDFPGITLHDFTRLE